MSDHISSPNGEGAHSIEKQVNSVNDVDIIPVVLCNSEDNLDTKGDSCIVNDEKILDEFNGSVSLDCRLSTRIANCQTPDFDLEHSSESKRNLNPGKDSHEASPLKEAIKGFVRNRLTKRTGPEGPYINQQSEKRTIFSGLKDKIVKKLEENITKEPLDVPEEIQKPHVKSEVSPENDQIAKSERELKSVVANDVLEPVIFVEEGEECFEESKHKNTSSVSRDDINANANLCLHPVLPPRSKTMTNIAATAQMLKSKLKSDKNMSISFSDLQKTDSLDVDSVLSNNNLDHNDIAVAGPSTSTGEESCSSKSLINNSPKVVENTHIQQITTSEASQVQRSNERNLSSLARVFRRGISFLFKYYLHIHIIVLLVSFITYKVFQDHPFLAGMVFGMLLISFFVLLYFDLTLILQDKGYLSLPDYKILLPADRPLVLPTRGPKYQGWMNLFKGIYNPDTYNVNDTTTVFVCIEGSLLTISYPKKGVPKRRLWNEKPIQIGTFLLEERFLLHKAKVVFQPPNLTRKRTFNKRYPLCIVFPDDRVRRSSVQGVSDVIEQEVDKSSESSSRNLSLPPSLSGSPAHHHLRGKILYLFARTAREKEEWYWEFVNATRFDVDGTFAVKAQHSEDCTSITSSTGSTVEDISVAVPSRSSSLKSVKTCTDLNVEEAEEVVSLLPLKPILNFNHYMSRLLQRDEKLERDKPNLQWLNILLGRLFYDFLVKEKWAVKIQEKIQRKLNRVEVPQYMEKLVATDVYLGTALPKIIRSLSHPVFDEQGMWFDFEIDYKGFFQMTLETRLKSLKGRSTFLEESKGEEMIESVPKSSLVPSASADETSDAGSINEDPTEAVLQTRAESNSSTIQPKSTRTRILQTVEKWATSTDNKFVKHCVQQVTQARLVLTVEVESLHGNIVLNIPPLPTDRVWYGFRDNPELNLSICPKVGNRYVGLLPVVQMIKKKLLLEFQKAVVLPNMDDFVIPLMHSPIFEK